MAFKIGIDVGGTFTDIVCTSDDGRVITGKALSTHQEITNGVITALSQLEGIDFDQITYVSHATTVACNALITNRGAKTAIITTEGFEDMLEMRRGQRVSSDPNKMYDVQLDLPQGYRGGYFSLVERMYRYGVPERIGPDGGIIRPLNEASLEKICEDIREKGIESICVCYMNCFTNPEHEQRTKKIINRLIPGICVSISSEVLSVIREYNRLSTTVCNAYVKPLVKSYMSKLQNRINEIGIDSTMYIMQSNGGIISAEMAGEYPVNILESGPSAGVIAVSELGRQMGIDQVIAFDMGGTTAKACAIVNSIPEITTEFWVDEKYFVGVPIINLVEVGAGGGSIAWIDRGGALKVGPMSAGSEPGPVCYGLGGTQPTVTDSNLILGYLNPDYFLGGKIKIDVDSAKKTLENIVCSKFGVNAAEAAMGVHNLSNMKMMSAIRVATLHRGHDPRDFTLFATGGAGPAHACRIAQEMGIPMVVIPPHPGTYSALGLLVADAQFNAFRSYITTVDTVEPVAIKDIYDDLEATVRRPLLDLGFKDEEIVIRRLMDMRYSGQSHEVQVELDGPVTCQEDIEDIRTKFHDEHEQLFGHSSPEEGIEIITLSVNGIGPRRQADIEAHQGSGRAAEPFCFRKVYFEEYGDYIDCPIYRRNLLIPGDCFDGPAIVEEEHSATVAPPECAVAVDSSLALKIKIGKL